MILKRLDRCLTLAYIALTSAFGLTGCTWRLTYAFDSVSLQLGNGWPELKQSTSMFNMSGRDMHGNFATEGIFISDL
ncbi:hypothetical protein B0H10DRAFT_1977678, partial [Mycena sp. CBHHK59/15]